MTHSQIIAAHTSTLIEAYTTMSKATGLNKPAFAQWFWESIISQYSSKVTKGLLSHIGIQKPANTADQQWAQFAQAHA